MLVACFRRFSRVRSSPHCFNACAMPCAIIYPDSATKSPGLSFGTHFFMNSTYSFTSGSLAHAGSPACLVNCVVMMPCALAPSCGPPETRPFAIPGPKIPRPNNESAASKPPAGDQWIHEIKFDGYRLQIHLNDGRVTVYTRNGHDWTKAFRSSLARSTSRWSAQSSTVR
jgi:hypothetical protein